jgi:hypothetical protein
MDLIEPSRFHRDGIMGIMDQLTINEERAKHGVSRADTWSFHDYMGVVLANGLRILAEDSHGWPDTEEYPTFESWTEKLNEVADKLIQASTTDRQIDKMYNEIEWSEEDLKPAGLEDMEDFSDWLNEETSTPAFKEYSRRTDEIRSLAEKNLEEAFEWLSKNWWGLWD